MRAYLHNRIFLEQFGKKIRRIRRSQDLTLKQLAERSGIGANHIALIERGEVNTSLSHIAQLATGLQKHPADLFLFDRDDFENP